MWLCSAYVASLAAVSLLLVAGCAQTCRATPERLASLSRGMSYQETSNIMGCNGKPILVQEGDGVTTMEWGGPGSSILVATDIDFRDDKLLYYITRSKGGF
jgi:hypothetical protein